MGLHTLDSEEEQLELLRITGKRNKNKSQINKYLSFFEEKLIYFTKTGLDLQGTPEGPG